MLKFGIHLPLPLFLQNLLAYNQLEPSQIVSNSWYTLISCYILWSYLGDDQFLLAATFMSLYYLKHSPKNDLHFYVSCRN